jgi:hypothetical protein
MAAFGATNSHPTAMTAAATRAYEGSHGRVVRSRSLGEPERRLVVVRLGEGRLAERTRDGSEAGARAEPGRERLEIAHEPPASGVVAAEEDLRVIAARVAAAVAERRVLACAADREGCGRWDAVRAAMPAEHLLQASAGGAGSSTASLRESAHGVAQSARTVTSSCAFEA